MKTDAQIRSDVLDELEWDPAVNANDIGVIVKPRLSSTDIQHGIERALTRHAEREAKHLQVLVEGSRVTLRGPAGS